LVDGVTFHRVIPGFVAQAGDQAEPVKAALVIFSRTKFQI